MAKEVRYIRDVKIVLDVPRGPGGAGGRTAKMTFSLDGANVIRLFQYAGEPVEYLVMMVAKDLVDAGLAGELPKREMKVVGELIGTYETIGGFYLSKTPDAGDGPGLARAPQISLGHSGQDVRELLDDLNENPRGRSISRSKAPWPANYPQRGHCDCQGTASSCTRIHPAGKCPETKLPGEDVCQNCRNAIVTNVRSTSVHSRPTKAMHKFYSGTVEIRIKPSHPNSGLADTHYWCEVEVPDGRQWRQNVKSPFGGKPSTGRYELGIAAGAALDEALRDAVIGAYIYNECEIGNHGRPVLYDTKQNPGRGKKMPYTFTPHTPQRGVGGPIIDHRKRALAHGPTVLDLAAQMQHAVASPAPAPTSAARPSFIEPDHTGRWYRKSGNVLVWFDIIDTEPAQIAWHLGFGGTLSRWSSVFPLEQFAGMGLLSPDQADTVARYAIMKTVDDAIESVASKVAKEMGKRNVQAGELIPIERLTRAEAREFQGLDPEPDVLPPVGPDGRLPKHVNGRPVYYKTEAGNRICARCANEAEEAAAGVGDVTSKLVGWGFNVHNQHMACTWCNQRIEADIADDTSGEDPDADIFWRISGRVLMMIEPASGHDWVVTFYIPMTQGKTPGALKNKLASLTVQVPYGGPSDAAHRALSDAMAGRLGQADRDELMTHAELDRVANDFVVYVVTPSTARDLRSGKAKP